MYDLFSYLIILTSSATLMQRGTNTPLHQSYQWQVLNMKCFTPQFVSGENKKYNSQSDTDKQVRWFLSFKPGGRLTDLTDTRATETKATGKTNPPIHYITIVFNFVLIVIYDLLRQFHLAYPCDANYCKFTNVAEAPVNKAARGAFMMAVLITLFTISDWYLLITFF